MDWIASLILGALALSSTIYFSWSANKRADQLMTKQLFTEFNERYNALNEVLNATEGKALTDIKQHPKLIDKIDDYCNLCAEQYYWKKAGRIDDVIWKAWLAGMKDRYKSHEAFREYWDGEVATKWESYYMDSESDNFLKL
jgi:hypothetical protein